MTTVKQILKEKGHEFYHVGPKSTVYEALQRMAEKDVGAMPVLDDEGTIIGMFTERDYARKLILHGFKSKESLIEDFMSKILYTVDSDMTTFECMAIMTEHRVRHLPVLDHNKIVGILSIGDIVNQIIKEQYATIKDLEKYITGSGYGHE
jgi:CBS domain-containing protein